MKKLGPLVLYCLLAGTSAHAQDEGDFAAFASENDADASAWQETISTMVPRGSRGLVIKVPEQHKDNLGFGELRFSDYEVAAAQDLEQAWATADEDSAIAGKDATTDRSTRYYYPYRRHLRIWWSYTIIWVPMVWTYTYYSYGFHYYYIIF